MSSWLKIECATSDKPEVLSITVAMGWDDPDLTVGKLFRVWRWFDQQTVDGNAAGVTAILLDKIAGANGFTEAMQTVGWLKINKAGITLPNFDRHNGQTAKKRAATAKRVANYRAKASMLEHEVMFATVQEDRPTQNKNSTISVTSNSTEKASAALARKEKRKSKSIYTNTVHGKVDAVSQSVRMSKQDLIVQGLSEQTAAELLDLRAQKKAAMSSIVWACFKDEVALLNISLEEAAKFWIASGWQGFRAEWVKAAMSKKSKKGLIQAQANKPVQKKKVSKHTFKSGAKSDGTIEL